MKLYACSNCKNPLYFENNICLNCQHTVGFDAAALLMVTLDPKGAEFADVSDPQKIYRFCKNAEYGTCNWLIPSSQTSSFCRACALNRVIPALASEENLRRWKNIEVAKHRLVYSLLRLKLPVQSKKDNEAGIAFDFMADASPAQRVMTGHDKGTITLNIEEADEAARVKHKLDLGEKYRTLLGHFRHETGHYYWEVLIMNKSPLQKFRKLFGNEQNDYGKALQTYYQTGAPANWSDRFISPYASSHPWEDWAESWAHYLHMMDTLETAFAFGIRINPVELKDEAAIKATIMHDPYCIANFDRIMKWWLPLSFAVNSLNRSMGHADFYPFVISAPVVEKLKFIHDLCLKNAQSPSVTVQPQH